jgi:hypothetical protein
VGTYSCHGIEPVYDEDEDDDDRPSPSSSSSSSDDDGSDAGDDERTKGGRRRNGGEERDVVACAKINQDRGGIAYPYGDSDRQALFAVYDGHGQGGELVSQYALVEVQRLLEARLKSMMMAKTIISGGVGDGVGGDGGHRRCGGVWDIEAEDGKDGKDGEDDEDDEDDEGCDAVAAAMTEVFLQVNRGLLNEEDIEVSFLTRVMLGFVFRGSPVPIVAPGLSSLPGFVALRFSQFYLASALPKSPVLKYFSAPPDSNIRSRSSPPPPFHARSRTHVQADVQRDDGVRGTVARRQIVRIQLRRFARSIGQEGGDD